MNADKTLIKAIKNQIRVYLRSSAANLLFSKVETLFQAGADRYVFEEAGQHRLAVAD
jgi:hypothetical protein